jgi:ribosomal protein L11 methyltransferase
MFIWRRRAGPGWLARNEQSLRELAGRRLAIIQKPKRKTATLEIAGRNRLDLEELRAKFGGKIERLPRDWLKRFTSPPMKPLRIGKRLVIVRSRRSTLPSRTTGLVVPAGRAFGTGEHATTAMSLRLLEQISRKLPRNWSMLDLGTGTGILALAAKKFGAGKVLGIDSDPAAISVARQNARLNGIGGIEFRHADARKICGASSFTVVTANLFSELLIEILPKLRRSDVLILSGILRGQEKQVVRNNLPLEARRRRGKWLALLCRKRSVKTLRRAIDTSG